MTDEPREDLSYYNLEGGQRLLVLKGGTLKAVAPGLRLVEPTEDERRRAGSQEAPKKPPEYGLPV